MVGDGQQAGPNFKSSKLECLGKSIANSNLKCAIQVTNLSLQKGDDAAGGDQSRDESVDVAKWVLNSLHLGNIFMWDMFNSAAETSLLQKIIRKGLVEAKSDIEVQRSDPTSPLFSVKTFEALRL